MWDGPRALVWVCLRKDINPFWSWLGCSRGQGLHEINTELLYLYVHLPFLPGFGKPSMAFIHLVGLSSTQTNWDSDCGTWGGGSSCRCLGAASRSNDLFECYTTKVLSDVEKLVWKAALSVENQCASPEPLKREEIPVDTIFTFSAER